MHDNNIHEFLFKNGLKLIVKEDHRAHIATFQIFYKVGSSYEHGGITGISHALEHMMFRGTKNHTADQFLQTISGYGGQQNAFTTRDYTAYYQIMSADKLNYSFQFEADRMENLLLQAKDFSKEIEIVMEERRMTTEDNPKRLTYERFAATAFSSSPYRYPVIGWMNDLKNMTVLDLKNWYRTWYAPNNAIIVLIGDIVPQKAYRLAKKYFGHIKPSVLPSIKPQKEIKPLGVRTTVVKTPAKLPWLIIGFNVPVINTIQDKWEPYALLVLCEILAGGKSARLQKNIIREKELALEVNYTYSPFERIDTLLTLSATPTIGHTVEELQKELFNEIWQLQNHLATHKELTRVKTTIIAEKVYKADSINHQACEIGSFEVVGLSFKEIEKAYRAIHAITLEQVQKVACKYLIPDHLTVTKLEPLPLPKTET